MGAAFRIALVVGVSLLAASCGRPNQFAQITMHDGTVLTVLEPQAFYQAVCDPGTTYLTNGEPDDSGLRAVRAGADPAKWDAGGMGPYDEIKWADIDLIVFGKGLGDLGDATRDCSGPLNVAATIHFKDGRAAQRALADTTDLGVEGLTERGPAIVPIRDIARLRVTTDGDGDWVKAQQNLDLPGTTLHIVRRDGSRVTVGDAEIVVPVERFSELGVEQYRVQGLPALAGGARLEIRWAFLASVKISGTAAALQADIVYADGHRERIALADGEIIEGTGIAPSDPPIKLDSIAEITVTTTR